MLPEEFIKWLIVFPEMLIHPGAAANYLHIIKVKQKFSQQVAFIFQVLQNPIEVIEQEHSLFISRNKQFIYFLK